MLLAWMEHFKEVDEHAQILLQGVVLVFFFKHNISVIPTCLTFAFRHQNLYNEKNMQKNLLCFSRFSWQLQIFYRAQLAIFCFQCFQLFEIVNPCFVTSNNICIYTFSLKQRHIFSIAQCLYLYSFLVTVDIHVCCIHLAEIFLNTFKIRFKMNITRDSDMPTALAISRIVYLPSLYILIF